MTTQEVLLGNASLVLELEGIINALQPVWQGWQ
jgi:hypothetical protein